MHRMLSITALAVLLTLRAATGQVTQLHQGDQVRLLVRGSAVPRLEGRIVALLPDRLVISGSPEDAPVTVPLDSFDRIQVRVRRPAAVSALAYGGLGLLVGAAGGALVGSLVLSSDCNSWRKDLDHQGGCVNDLLFDDSKRVRAMVLFAGVGAGLGAVVGALRGLDRWQEVGSDRIRVALAPQPGGIAAAASVRF